MMAFGSDNEPIILGLSDLFKIKQPLSKGGGGGRGALLTTQIPNLDVWSENRIILGIGNEFSSPFQSALRGGDLGSTGAHSHLHHTYWYNL